MLKSPKNWERLVPGTPSLYGPAARRRSGRARGLDAHDGGAVVGEVLGGDGPGHQPGEVGDLEPGEGKAAAVRGCRLWLPGCGSRNRGGSARLLRPCALRVVGAQRRTVNGGPEACAGKPGGTGVLSRWAAARPASSPRSSSCGNVSRSATVFTGRDGDAFAQAPVHQLRPWCGSSGSVAGRPATSSSE